MSRRPRREFTEEFKLQMVKLYNNSRSFKEADNRTEDMVQEK